MKILLLGYNPGQTSLYQWLSQYGRVLHTSEKLNDLSDYDLVISYGYRHIIDTKTIVSARRPPINLHMSYLPFNRGAHPNFWCWMENTPAGFSIHEIDEGLDTGPVVFQKRFFLPDQKATFDQTYWLLREGIEKAFKEIFPQLIAGNYKLVSQVVNGTSHKMADLPVWLKNWNMSISEAWSLFNEKKNGEEGIYVCLGNWMDEHGNLNIDSCNRLDLLIKRIRNKPLDALLSGWKYRSDICFPISVAMERYVKSKYSGPAKIFTDDNARETVGDAVFSRIWTERQNRELDYIFVITSDYHVARVQEIFRFVYPKSVHIEIFGAKSSCSDTKYAEQASLMAFRNTFKGVLSGDLGSIVDRMCSDHPYYNGSISPKINSIMIEGIFK